MDENFPKVYCDGRGQYSIVYAFWHNVNGKNVHINYTFTQIEIALSVHKSAAALM